MEILGLYGNASQSTTLKILKELHNAQLFLPIVFTLESDTSIVTNHIGIFPSLYSVDRRATIHQVLAQSICKDKGDLMVTKADNITRLSIYLINPSNLPSIYVFAKDIAVSFPRIDWLFLWFERQSEIVSFLLAVNDYNRAWPKVYMYHFSHDRILKESFLSSPICVG